MIDERRNSIMKYFIKIFILPVLIIACSENPIESKEEKKFWSVPTDEAIWLQMSK